jgi:hypothetical protein
MLVFDSGEGWIVRTREKVKMLMRSMFQLNPGVFVHAEKNITDK